VNIYHGHSSTETEFDKRCKNLPKKFWQVWKNTKNKRKDRVVYSLLTYMRFSGWKEGDMKAMTFGWCRANGFFLTPARYELILINVKEFVREKNRERKRQSRARLKAKKAAMVVGNV
jgi:hypothetical protein